MLQCGLDSTQNPTFLSEESNTRITMNMQSYDMTDTLTDFSVDHIHWHTYTESTGTLEVLNRNLSCEN